MALENRGWTHAFGNNGTFFTFKYVIRLLCVLMPDFQSISGLCAVFIACAVLMLKLMYIVFFHVIHVIRKYMRVYKGLNSVQFHAQWIDFQDRWELAVVCNI